VGTRSCRCRRSCRRRRRKSDSTATSRSSSRLRGCPSERPASTLPIRQSACWLSIHALYGAGGALPTLFQPRPVVPTAPGDAASARSPMPQRVTGTTRPCQSRRRGPWNRSYSRRARGLRHEWMRAWADEQAHLAVTSERTGRPGPLSAAEVPGRSTTHSSPRLACGNDPRLFCHRPPPPPE
jgi:hypothetical protein